MIIVIRLDIRFYHLWYWAQKRIDLVSSGVLQWVFSNFSDIGGNMRSRIFFRCSDIDDFSIGIAFVRFSISIYGSYISACRPALSFIYFWVFSGIRVAAAFEFQKVCCRVIVCSLFWWKVLMLLCRFLVVSPLNLAWKLG